MLRALLAAALLLCGPGVLSAQTAGILRLSVQLPDGEQRPTPVPRYALLISDNPPTASPRRVITGADGTALVRLPPGNYTVESDSPIALGGNTYEWTVSVDVTSGAEVSLALTAANASVERVESGPNSAGDGTDPKLLALRWRSAVVSVWTPTTRLSGFLADATGLLLTNQRGVASAKTVEVQVSPERKVSGRVIASDDKADVAVIQVNPQVFAGVTPVPVDCSAGHPPVAENTDIVTLAAPMSGSVTVIPGSIDTIGQPNIVTDFILDFGATGGPAFAVTGQFAGLTSTIAIDNGRTSGHVSLSTAENACRVLASATPPRTGVPSTALLPIEPAKAFPLSALDSAMRTRAGALSAYTMATSDFDLAFMTPIQVHAGQERALRLADGASRAGTGGTRLVNPEDNFANWSAYVTTLPPVLLIRATPRLAEGFLTTLARGAALTQGVALPSMKRPKAGFDRMTVTCGTTAVTPVHALTIEQPVSDTDVIDEGLYAFDPSALGPHCGTVKIEVFSQKDPAKGDTRIVDPKIVEQFFRDFEPLRAAP